MYYHGKVVQLTAETDIANEAFYLVSQERSDRKCCPPSQHITTKSLHTYELHPKLHRKASSKINSIVEGSGADSAGIKAAIVSQNVTQSSTLPAWLLFSLWARKVIAGDFATIVEAAFKVKTERGGAPLRCWFLSGWSRLDSPKLPHIISD